MNLEPPISSSRKPTPLEQALYTVYRSSSRLAIASFIGFLLYILVGFTLLTLTPVTTSYPFLSLEADPTLHVFISTTSLLVCLAMLSLIPLTLFRSQQQTQALIIVLSGSIAIGLSGSAAFYSIQILMRLFGLD